MVDIHSIWAGHRTIEETTIKTKIDSIPNFNCFAATNHITGHHLFIFEIQNTTVIPDFKVNRFKGLAIEVLKFDSHKELIIILLDIQIKDVFCMFIENILEEILSCVTENEALIVTSNIVFKWKKLFDKINFQGLTIEQQKGLIGELLFINELLDKNYPTDSLFESWTGPDNHDKDFIFGGTGIEVKLTSSKYPTLKITNERQLDNSGLNKLFLFLFIVEEVKENGFSLFSLVEQIRQKIQFNHQALKFFNQRLTLIGYLDEDRENYLNEYRLMEYNKYEVSTGFPKISPSELPVGVFNTSYSIEISTCIPFLLQSEDILEILNNG